MQYNILDILKKRNLIKQITNEVSLVKKLRSPISIYCGFDPTADSLHIGHLIPILCLKRFLLLGHKVIILIGGATSLIGDPSLLNKKRNFNKLDKVELWSKKIEQQIINIVGNDNNLIILNNYNWLSSLNFLEFLKDFGQYFNINQIFNRNLIKERIKKNKGVSFSELSYSLLQSYDFYYLYKNYNVTLQIGGSDQWVNITSGINLVRSIFQIEVYGMTLKLFMNSNGIKFSKTEKNTIWLDCKKTSPYKLYQFLININDNDVYSLLGFLTLLDLNYIIEIQKQDLNREKIKPQAQKLLAEEVTRIVHGKKAVTYAKKISNFLFNKNISSLSQSDFKEIQRSNEIPIIFLSSTGSKLQKILLESKLALSMKQAKNLIKSKSILVNNTVKDFVDYDLQICDIIHKNYTIICKGKKSHCLFVWDI